MEIWKTIPGYKGFYEASNLGKIRRIKRITNHSKDGIIKPKLFKDGYVYTELCKKNKRKIHRLGRLIAMVFLGKKPRYIQVNHKDGNKQNNNIDNLHYVTRSENMIHAYEKGLQKPLIGDDCPSSKLNSKQVIEIRKKYAKGNITHKALADEYKIGNVAIHCIVVRKSWKHI